MKSGRYDKIKKVIGAVLFIIYLIFMIYVMFLMDWRSRNLAGPLKYNAVPFHEIKRYLHLLKVYPYISLMNLFGNVLIFIPFGALVTFFKRAERVAVLRVTLLAFTVSCSIELIQLFTRVGSCDVDDVILNTLGGFIGSLIYYIHYHWRKSR
ncbi:MAG: VanZ family protein [Lachnospiraceae bacterium]|uniref:VanZ family protein n=1 Tax=Candidatus Weimeria bifida TaxID=2599074 RepID=A0A6N7J266_9FIRM|nr:VanZ family protein [Candidatus Weimeria bifida]RRF96495.1 MAG: VanZ family protein [Lachnospiraceae bacterium]